MDFEDIRWFASYFVVFDYFLNMTHRADDSRTGSAGRVILVQDELACTCDRSFLYNRPTKSYFLKHTIDAFMSVTFTMQLIY